MRINFIPRYYNYIEQQVYFDMSNTSKQSQSFEKLGFIPRSIIRTITRFSQQVTQKSTKLILYEFKISRYQAIVAIKCLVTFILLPLLFHLVIVSSIHTLLDQTQFIFLENLSNSFQLNNSYLEIQKFDEQYFFDTFLSKQPSQLDNAINDERIIILKQLKQKQFNCLKTKLCNLGADLVTIGAMIFLIKISIPQIIILKSFFIEFLYNLSDTTKSFFLIFITDLLVGFHSSRAWELTLILFFNRLEISIEHDIILLIVSIFPVILDTVFKYWIFRFLNKISPSTVATYQNMLE